MSTIGTDIRVNDEEESHLSHCHEFGGDTCAKCWLRSSKVHKKDGNDVRTVKFDNFQLCRRQPEVGRGLDDENVTSL